jgi:hypothetical protein
MREDRRVHARLVQGPDLENFQLHLRYNRPKGGEEKVKLKITPLGADCIDLPTELDWGEEQQFVCKRKLQEGNRAPAVTISVNPSPLEDTPLTLSAYAPPPTPSPKPSEVSLMTSVLNLKWCTPQPRSPGINMIQFRIGKGNQIYAGVWFVSKEDGRWDVEATGFWHFISVNEINGHIELSGKDFWGKTDNVTVFIKKLAGDEMKAYLYHRSPSDAEAELKQSINTGGGSTLRECTNMPEPEFRAYHGIMKGLGLVD